MLYRQHLLALAASALLAACGGGADTATVTPEAAASTMRAHALSSKADTSNIYVNAAAAAATTVTPEEAAKQLMDYAETVFKVYFPEHQSTLTFGPFRYRVYSTGIILGVVVTAGDATYSGVGDVYVMGGVFGNSPLRVGPLTSFITPTAPVDPGPGPTGSGNGCFDLALIDTEGTRSVVTYQHTGSETGTTTVDTLTGALTTFEGQQAREITVKITGTLTTSGQTAAADSQVKNYQRRTGEAEITNYGSSFNNSTVISGFTSTIVSKSVYSPPCVDRSSALAEGQSLTTTQNLTTTVTTTITGSPVPLPPTTNTSTSSFTQTVKYVGRESVTVPAGTYSTCKYEYNNSGVVSTNWFIVGKGLGVKSVSTVGNTTQTLQATSVTLNGQRL